MGDILNYLILLEDLIKHKWINLCNLIFTLCKRNIFIGYIFFVWLMRFLQWLKLTLYLSQ